MVINFLMKYQEFFILKNFQLDNLTTRLLQLLEGKLFLGNIMFKDEAKIYVKAGDGGNGCISFRREKYVPKGGPDGGDGGKGGNIIIESVGNCNTLLDLTRRRKYHAEKGKQGRGSLSSGKSGKDTVIKVPPGTIVKEIQGDKEEVISDFKKNW